MHEHHPGCGHIEELTEEQFHHVAEHIGHICSELCGHLDHPEQQAFEQYAEAPSVAETEQQPWAETAHEHHEHHDHDHHHHQPDASSGAEEPVSTEMLWQTMIQEKPIFEARKRQRLAAEAAVGSPAEPRSATEQAESAPTQTRTQKAAPAEQHQSLEVRAESAAAQPAPAAEAKPPALAEAQPEAAATIARPAGPTIEENSAPAAEALTKNTAEALPAARPTAETFAATAAPEQSTDFLPEPVDNEITVEPATSADIELTFEAVEAKIEEDEPEPELQAPLEAGEQPEPAETTAPAELSFDETAADPSETTVEKIETSQAKAVRTVLAELQPLVSLRPRGEASRQAAQGRVAQLAKILGATEPAEVIKSLIDNHGLTAEDQLLLELFELLSQEQHAEGRSTGRLFADQFAGSSSGLGKVIVALVGIRAHRRAA